LLAHDILRSAKRISVIKHVREGIVRSLLEPILLEPLSTFALQDVKSVRVSAINRCVRLALVHTESVDENERSFLYGNRNKGKICVVGLRTSKLNHR
ncbi:hypothetical protein PFISCL1PPCAC_15115, partial [Pristionchus fissidentatus]